MYKHREALSTAFPNPWQEEAAFESRRHLTISPFPAKAADSSGPPSQ